MAEKKQKPVVKKNQDGFWARAWAQGQELYKKLDKKARPHLVKAYAWSQRRIIAPSLRLWYRIASSVFGQIVARQWGRFVVWLTALYRRTPYLPQFVGWLEGHYQNFRADVLARYQAARVIWAKLTAPAPDPLTAALMLGNEPIDIDDDTTQVKGNTVFVMISTFFIIFLLWAMFTELDQVVRAEATIVPPSSVQLVQSRLPGSVIEINAKLGDRVRKGDVLFRIEDEDVIANFDDNEITRASAIATVARLEAELAGADSVSFPEWLAQKNASLVASETKLFETRRKALKTRLIVLERAIKEKETEAKIAASNIATKREQIKITEPLVKEGHETRLVLLNLQNELAQAEGAQSLAEIAAARSRDEYESVLSEYNAEVSTKLAEVKNVADQAGAREDALRGKVSHASVKAPTDGTISAVHIKTVGGVVEGGKVMAEIVPDEQSLLVRARILAEDVTSVYLDQTAQISLSSYDVSRYGTLEGHVQRIAANTTEEEGLPPYYETMITIPSPRFSKSTEDVEVVPGMTAMVDIIGKKRTVLSYILSPLDRAAGVAFRE